MKHRICKSFLLLAFCTAIGNNLHAQLHIDSLITQLGEKYPQEKIYMQFDKSYYNAGETIWFKAYLMDGLFPAQQTKTIYIDWVGDNGEVLAHTVSPVVEGTSNGQLDIPDTEITSILDIIG